MILFFKAWSNARFSANDAGSSSSRRGRRAKSHVGQSVASLVCFLKCLRYQSLNQLWGKVPCLHAGDRVREDSSRKKVKMDMQFPSGSTGSCRLHDFAPILLHADQTSMFFA